MISRNVSDHKADCIWATVQKAVEEYQATWPGYCRACSGVGTVTWRENQSPLGSGLDWPMDMEDVCSECVDKGRCPRCRGNTEEFFKDSAVDYYCRCPACGWTDDPEVESDGGCPENDHPCTCVGEGE